MKKLIYRTNGIDNVIDVPLDATNARIIDLPELGDLVRITKMGTGANDRPEYIGRIGNVVAMFGTGRSCTAEEILVGDCGYYVRGWEILARKGELL